MTSDLQCGAESDLIANGYEPVACLGKAPVGEGWQSRPNTVERIAAERARVPAATNTGLRTGRTVAIDIDLWNPEHASQLQTLVERFLGETSSLNRVGAKGCLLVYQTDEPGPKLQVKGIDPDHPERKKQGVEILGQGQQFVAFGIHPDTGQAYQWIGIDWGASDLAERTPLNTPLADLPKVSRAQLEELTRRAAALLTEFGYEQVGGKSEGHSPAAGEVTGARLTRKGLRERLSCIHPAFGGERPACYPPQSESRAAHPLPYTGDDWVRLGLCIRGGGIPLIDGPEDWGQLVEDWSHGLLWQERTGETLDGLNIPEAGVVKRLKGADTKGCTVATLIDYARDGGCPLGPDDEDPAVKYNGAAREQTSEPHPAENDDAEPLDILRNLASALPELQKNMLPDAITEYAFDAAARLGVEPAMVGCSMLVVCAAMIDDGLQIQPKALDTEWKESARLNMLGNAPPSFAKSPILRIAMEPAREIEAVWRKEDAEAIKRWERMEKYRLALEKRALKDIETHDNATALAATPVATDKPVKRRLIVNDATPEGLCKILAGNQRGVLLGIDEAVGWLAGFDAYRNGSEGKDRAFWLQVDNGGSYAIDRANDDRTIEVPNLSASILGFIQPEKLRKWAPKLTDDGFLQRAFVINANHKGAGLDKEPDDKAATAYRNLLHQLLEIKPGLVTLSPEAQKVRREVEEIAASAQILPTTSTAFAQHLGKWPGRFARLLLTFHAIECTARDEPVGDKIRGETAERVRDFMLKFLYQHQRHFYETYFRAASFGARDWIAGYILARGSGRVTMREIKRAYRTDDEVPITTAMEQLQAANWVGEVQYDRQSTWWHVNPKVHARFAARAEAEKTRREEVQRRIAEAITKTDGL